MASINPCKNTTSDKRIPVDYCSMNILVTYRYQLEHTKPLLAMRNGCNTFFCKLLRKYKSVLLFWILFIRIILRPRYLVSWLTGFKGDWQES